LGLAVCNEDEAGAYQAIPQPGHSWQPEGKPARYPHEYVRSGTAKLLTLLHPATGQVRVKGVTSSANVVLHPWIKEQLSEILATLPKPTAVLAPEENRAQWVRWQEGLSVRLTLLGDLAPLRMLLILDNRAGHKTPEFVCWLMEHGIMPLYTPVGGSWMNRAESVQRILVRRALAGQHPRCPEEVIEWLEATACGWNREPTPFIWGGKRKARRERAWRRRHGQSPVGGSGACTLRLVTCSKSVRELRLCA
jgi:hypothetical protein